MDRSRLCVRPDCAAPAEAALCYDYGQRIAWIDALGPEAAPGVWALCAGHADNLTVPHGWSREDRRRSDVLPTAPPLTV